MTGKAPGIIALAFLNAGIGWCQTPRPSGQNVPLYRVTVIERTVKAVNYQYRSGQPTQIDFRGTVLLPEAKGAADVESKAGRVDIDAHFDRLKPPTRYGHEYLTYVLWAITPEGHAKNLGEILAGGSDKAKLHVTTDLQAFGLIVTAEPYAAVRQPSDVVVMENEIRPDTVGKIEPIQAKYDLLPRGEYTYQVPADLIAAEGNGPTVSMNKYEEMVELYQAQNAVQIAGAMGAAQYASDTFARAQELLRSAQALESTHSDRSRAIQDAREAAQTAEDARVITVKRKQDAEVASATAQAAQDRQRLIQAEAEAQTARAQSSADRAMLDQERMARQQAEAQAAATPQVQAAPAPPQQVIVPLAPAENLNARKRDSRIALYQQLGACALETSDTPRGLMVTIPASDFSGRNLQPAVVSRVGQVASILRSHPGLTVEVDENGEALGRGEAVRMALIQAGVPAAQIVVREVGNSRPIASNATPEGRELNRRVEIAITGDSIGNMPYWDRSYSLSPRE
ncbi:MAG TPA: OmpA family protein [Candidatus Sulfopaludibacter sp.]|jgi:flagellar motor protein MotB|nr:OmpA family protein [Candidatus Sulfopaludibacter sp.]